MQKYIALVCYALAVIWDTVFEGDAISGRYELGFRFRVETKAAPQ